MLEAVCPSWHRLSVLHHGFGGIVMVVMRVLGYAATTAVGWHEPVEAAADDALAILTGDVGDAMNRGAVLAPGRVRGEGHHATTTCNMGRIVSSVLYLFVLFSKGASTSHNKSVPFRPLPGPDLRRYLPRQAKRNFKKKGQRLTAFEIALRVDALPRAWTTAVDTARQPAVSPLRARAAAEPSPSVFLHPMRGTRALGHAFVVADFHVVPLAFTLFRFVRRGRRESVRAHESAWVSVDTGGRAVLRVNAVS